MTEQEQFEAWWAKQKITADDSSISPLAWKMVAWNGWIARSQRPEGDAIKLLQRWRDLYGGSTCTDKASQKDMTELDKDTEAFLERLEPQNGRPKS